MDPEIETNTLIGAELARLHPEQAAPKPPRSALREFLDNAIDHEIAGLPIPNDLVVYGLAGAALVIAGGLLGLVVSHPDALRHSSFLLLFRGPAADVGSVLHSLAVPLLIVGAVLVAGGLFLIGDKPRSLHWRYAIVGQTVCGGAAASVSLIFVLFFLLNAIIWLILIALALMAIGAIIAGLLNS